MNSKMEDLKQVQFVLNEVIEQLSLNEENIQLFPDYNFDSKDVFVNDTKNDLYFDSYKTLTGFEQPGLCKASAEEQNSFENLLQSESEKFTISANCTELSLLKSENMHFTDKVRAKSKAFSFTEDSIIITYEDKENDEFLTDAINEAISKYEKENDLQSERFKEASVQTVFNSSFVFECKCKLQLQTKNDIENECPLKKKAKLKECEHSFLSYKNLHNVEDFTDNIGSLEMDQASVRNESIFSFLKPTSKIRLGLSKRAKPRSLHKKLIF